jgi:hypothetical protein
MTRTELAAVWPSTASAAREADHKPQSALGAIREKHRDCYQMNEIGGCEAVKWALWPFGPGKHWRTASRKTPLTNLNSKGQTAPEDEGLPSC